MPEQACRRCASHIGESGVALFTTAEMAADDGRVPFSSLYARRAAQPPSDMLARARRRDMLSLDTSR